MDRENIYIQVLKSLSHLLEENGEFISNTANASALIKENLGFLWIGFYLVNGDELILGPFQGPVACTRIMRGKGVCGAAWDKKESIIVDDVEKFPGHITCSEASKSEIVVPVLNKAGEVMAILDIDSDKLADFTEVDRKYLLEITSLIADKNG